LDDIAHIVIPKHPPWLNPKPNFNFELSHIGIHGNTVVDQEAKNALDDPVSNCSIPYRF